MFVQLKTKQNSSRLPIAADTSTIQFIHIGNLVKEWHW